MGWGNYTSAIRNLEELNVCETRKNENKTHTYMKRLFVISACLIGLIACQREEILEPKTVGFEAKTVHADETRAFYDSQRHAISWEEGDEIGCFADMSTNVKFTNSEESPSIFTGTVWADPKEYHFYFPFSLKATAEGTVLTSTYPDQHELKVDDVSTTPVLVGSSSNLSNGVNFHNGCGLVKFTVKSDVAKKLIRAEFCGNNNEPIAGAYTIDMDSDTPSMRIASGGATKITLNGEVSMEANQEYSFILALPPTSFSNGITIKLWDDNSTTMTKTFDGALELGRNKAINISTVLEYTEANSEPVVDMQIQSFNVSSINGATIEIDNDKNTVTITKSGFTDPRSVTVSMSAAVGKATRAGEQITVTLEPTTTIVAGGTIHPDNTGVITNPSSFKMNLMMARRLTLTAGEFSETYTVKFSQLTEMGLPVVYINTSTGKDVPVNDKDTWIEGSEIYIDADGKTTFDRKALSDLANIECEIKGRGNTTWEWVKMTDGSYTNGAKRPYAIKLDKKKEVLGMANHKRWVLLNNFADKSLIRNYIAFRIANALASAPGGSGEWHPTGQPVELVMNGLHRGSYFLCEQIKISEGRVKGTEYDDKIHTPAVTNQISYLLEGDRNWGKDASEKLYWISYRKDSKWQESENGTYVYGTRYYEGEAGGYPSGESSYRFRWGLKSPDDGDLGENGAGRNTAAYEFMKTHVTDVEEYFLAADDDENGFKTTTSLAEIENYIDLDSFIEYWLVYEIATNQEPNNPGSCYMHYYEGDGKLYMGPVWDFDYGGFLTSAQFSDDGRYQNKDTHFQLANALWYCSLLQNVNVQDYIIERWNNAYRSKVLAVASEISTMKPYLKASAENNFTIWKMGYDGYTDPNTERNMSFEDAIDRIQTNINSRVEQLDELINNKRYY